MPSKINQGVLSIISILSNISLLSVFSKPSRKSIPKSDIVLPHDISELQKALIPLLRDTLSWNDVNDENITIEPISGALTNYVFFVTKTLKNGATHRVVLKVDGDGIDEFLNRKKELDLLQKLSTKNIGPQLLAIFGNGRIEEYLHSVTLKRSDIPSASPEIAAKLNQLHNLTYIFPSNKQEPEVWANISRWYPLAAKVAEKRRKDLEEFGFESFQNLSFEIEELKEKLSRLNSPIVFAHNDAQYGNVLRLSDGSNKLVLVDYEYSGFNYQAFDSANFFAEWMYDYHGKNPHDMHPDWYPNSAQRNTFFRSYFGTESLNEISLRKFELDTEAFVLASHVMWGLWGLAKSAHVLPISEADFDYFKYGAQRLKQFRTSKNDVYEKVNI